MTRATVRRVNSTFGNKSRVLLLALVATLLVSCDPEQSRLGVKSTDGAIEIIYACSQVDSVGFAIVTGRDQKLEYLWKIVAEGAEDESHRRVTMFTVGVLPDGFREVTSYETASGSLTGKSLGVMVESEGVLDFQEFKIDELQTDRYFSASTMKSADELLQHAEC